MLLTIGRQTSLCQTRSTGDDGKGTHHADDHTRKQVRTRNFDTIKASVPRPVQQTFGHTTHDGIPTVCLDEQPNASCAGPIEPDSQSQSFSRSYGSDLPTSLTYIYLSTRGFTPRRPAADSVRLSPFQTRTLSLSLSVYNTYLVTYHVRFHLPHSVALEYYYSLYKVVETL